MIKTKKYNCLGDDITEIRIVVEKSEFGYVDNNNIPHINWGTETDVCDANGFDKNYRPDDSDIYLIENYIIPNGSIICRYGNPSGMFTTIKGTAYEELSLPYIKETIEYHEYKVTADLSVKCIVTKGVVAPKFSSLGGGIQFMHKQMISLECEDGFLEEDKTWLQKNI